MPKITIDLTDTQAGKVMAANGWKPEELSVIVKRWVFEKINTLVEPDATQTKVARHGKPPTAEPRETSTFPQAMGQAPGN